MTIVSVCSLFKMRLTINNGQIPRQLISVRESWSLTLLVGWRSGQNVTLNFHSFFSFDFLQGVVPGFDLPQLVELLWIHWSKIQNHHWSYLESIWANTNKNTDTPGSDSASSLIILLNFFEQIQAQIQIHWGQIQTHLQSYCWIIGSGAAVQDHAEEP